MTENNEYYVCQKCGKIYYQGMKHSIHNLCFYCGKNYELKVVEQLDEQTKQYLVNGTAGNLACSGVTITKQHLETLSDAIDAGVTAYKEAVEEILKERESVDVEV